MSIDLDRDLRVYMSYVDSVTQSAAESDVVVAAMSPVTPLPSRRRKVWVVAAAAVATLLLIGGVAWLTRAPATIDPAGQGDVGVASYLGAVAESALVLGEDPTVLQPEPGPEPRFDTSELGSEVVFEPVPPDAAILDQFYNPSSGENPDLAGPILYVGLATENEWLLVVNRSGDGLCQSLYTHQIYSEGPCHESLGYGWTSGGGWGGDDAGAFFTVFVPLNTSVVGITTSDGQRLWQRPRGGWGVFGVSPTPEGSPGPTIVAYDPFGSQIDRWPDETSAPDEVEAPSTTLTVPISVADALSVTDAYFAAYNAGDGGAMLSLLTTDAVLTWRFVSPGVADFFEEFDRAGWERRLAWYAAQGTVLTPPSCTAADDQPVVGMTLSCMYDTLDAPTRAVDALPVVTTTRLTVTSLGISAIHETYQQPDFLHVGDPFRRWLEANRPDVTCLAVSSLNTSCNDPTTLEGAHANGLLIAQYAEEWATYLEANDCTYLDGC